MWWEIFGWPYLVGRDRAENAGRSGMMEAFGLAPEHHIKVMRGQVFEDALEALGPAVLRGDMAGGSFTTGTPPNLNLRPGTMESIQVGGH